MTERRAHGTGLSAAVRAMNEERRETLAVIADLERELAAVAESTAQSPDDEHDAEGSTVGFERARVGSLLRTARRSLEEIDEAIVRVESGEYGTCVECGRPIDPRRLIAMPRAARCVECARRPRM